MADTYDDFSTPFPDDCPDDGLTELDHAIAMAWLLGIDVQFDDDKSE